MRHVAAYGLFLFICIGFLWFLYDEYRVTIQGWFVAEEDAVQVYIADKPFLVSIADEPEERRQGLSDTPSLGRFQGKLFIFETADRHGIWMKDMNYAIDILWFDEAFRLIHVAERVDPDSFPTVFAPNEPARYVVELYEGAVTDMNISEGDVLSVPPAYLPE